MCMCVCWVRFPIPRGLSGVVGVSGGGGLAAVAAEAAVAGTTWSPPVLALLLATRTLQSAKGAIGAEDMMSVVIWGRNAAHGNMAADSGMETCPSSEIPDSRKRPLDGEVENGTTKRSHYGGGKWT